MAEVVSHFDHVLEHFVWLYLCGVCVAFAVSQGDSIADWISHELETLSTNMVVVCHRSFCDSFYGNFHINEMWFSLFISWIHNYLNIFKENFRIGLNNNRVWRCASHFIDFSEFSLLVHGHWTLSMCYISLFKRVVMRTFLSRHVVLVGALHACEINIFRLVFFIAHFSPIFFFTQPNTIFIIFFQNF